ncbi:nuclear transport factor 2 family protein [Sphingomonas sp. A2-49]|uniref:nuclear transport factor 2 family protein n=1 Tax=Sphingomonas sp. A2-49 TaxID=1391375 RepID=UPI0021D33759|nr:nuclear transport factor 2 family protein [Sphingomonas sp. A2-49]MCU6453910.1 nuclear transport factor 2 family protein [Sphingomonas sp. A2-49]
MDRMTLCERYLAALDAGDRSAVLALFAPDAVVSSPLYGTRDAASFYAALFADTTRSKTRLLAVFDAATAGNAVALHFEYDWTLHTGALVSFECVDVFRLTSDGRRFQSLTIIYDTAPIRTAFAEASRRTPEGHTSIGP